MSRFHDKSGVALVELLVSVAIIGIIMGSIYQLMGSTFLGYETVERKQKLLDSVSLVMGRMVMFVQETDDISTPGPGQLNHTTLIVSEQLLDTYDNASHAYTVDGDGILDADNDSDGLVDEDGASGSDPREYVEFKLNGDILETSGPDYGTAAANDSTAYETLCEHVKVFECDRLANNLVEIRLTLDDGNDEVSLKTRVKARNVQ